MKPERTIRKEGVRQKEAELGKSDIDFQGKSEGEGSSRVGAAL